MSIKELDRQYVAGTYKRFPVEIVSGKGSVVRDTAGKEYIDMGSGIGVTAFGIADDVWQKAVTDQIGRVQHMSNLYYTEPCARLAEMLCKKTGMKKVFFSNSGAEANECAIKAARKYAAETRGAEDSTIVTLKNSFHGRTLTTLAATGQEHYHELYQPLTPGFVHAEPGDLDDVKRLCEENRAAAVMIECIQGEGGVLVQDKDFVCGIARWARENGILLVVDEVQTGNGRTGKLYSYMNYDIEPDVVSTAKGLAGGLPLGATLLGESIINGAGENQSKMILVLKDWSKRGAGESLYEIVKRVQKISDDIPEAEVFALRLPPVKGMGSQGGIAVLFQSIGDNDPVKFSREVLRMRGELAKSPLAEAVNGGFYTDTPHLRVTIDRAKCELMKVPMSSIYTALQHNLGSIYVNDVNLGTQVNRVTAMADWSGRARPEDIRRLYVRSKTGAMVPIDTLVTCSEELGPRACYRCNQFLYCTEQFIPKPGVSTSEAIGEILRICRDKLSPGFINDWAGFTYESLKSRGDEGFLFGLAIFLVYLVLVAHLESWRAAFRQILPSVTAVFGAILALTLSGDTTTGFSQ